MFGSIINLICSFTFAGSSEEIDLLKTWKNYMILPLIYFIAVNNIDEENLVKKIIICICFTMLAMDFNFYTTFKWLKQYHYSDSMRISGAFSFLGPNELSIFYNMYTFLLLGIFYFIEEKKIKYLILFVCACNCYPILFSFSRTGYMCAIAGLLTLGLLKDRKFLVLLVALIICYRFVLPQAVVERIDMTFLEKDNISQEEQQSSAFDVGGTTLEITGRKHLWEKAMNYFEKEPLLGIGFDNFRRQEGWITHSLYMRILAEQGLIGATIFIVFITTILWQSLRLFRHSKSKLGQGIGLGFLISIIVHLVGSATGDQSLYYNLMAIFWLFMGIVASLRKYGSSNSNNKGCQIDPLEP
jgi:O-antigen ligase